MTEAHFAELRALIVEDNIHMRTVLRSLLKALGIRNAYEACDGDEGLTALRVQEPDFILTDLSMAPMDGIAFTQRVRLSAETPNAFVPIIMVTGHTERRRVEAARDAGVTEILAKPITPKSLYARITEIVERPRAFVRCGDYFGPDRRRRSDKTYQGPWRRHDDPARGLAMV